MPERAPLLCTLHRQALRNGVHGARYGFGLDNSPGSASN
jgi:hypothetical protein